MELTAENYYSPEANAEYMSVSQFKSFAGTDGKLACEAEAMQFKGASMRKESRGWFLREDYPQMDNENWLKWIVCENKDGKMEFSTEDVPIDTYQVQPPRF